MQNPQGRLRVLAVVTLLTWGGLAQAQAPVATVQTMSGSVTLRRKGQTALMAAAARAALFVGDLISTGSDGKAALLFTDGSQLRLDTNSEIEITALRSARKGKRRLFKAVIGRVWAWLQQDNEVQTPTAVCGVRGTELHLTIAADGETRLTVLEGEVEFFNQLGSETVRESQESVARMGAAPSKRVTIANAASVIEWTLDLKRVIIPREKFYLSPDRRNLQDALKQRAERARLEPNSAEARRDYGDALYDNGKFTEALKEYQESDRLSPNQPATLTRIGYALFELDRLNESEVSFKAATGATALVGLAEVELARNRPVRAQDWAEQALLRDSQNVEARIALGLAQMRQGRLNEARESLERARPHYQAHAWLALVYSEMDDQATALKEAQQATTLAPQSALARGNLALVYFFSKKPHEAEREARQAIQYNPDSVSARCVLAQAFLANGDVDAAAQTSAQAVALDPTLPQARYMLGIADMQRRDFAPAAKQLKECLRLAPDFLPAASALARTYTRMGRKQDAIAAVNELRGRHRRTDGVLAALAEVYYEQGRYRDSEDQYREAIKLSPNSGRYYGELTRVLIDANRLREAIRTGQKAIELVPEVAQYHANLGLAYDFSGLPAQAEREYRRALTLDYRNSLARVRLGLITPNATNASVVAINEAFMQDPGISEQLLRGGIDTEVIPAAGNRGQRNAQINNRQAAMEGRFHHFGISDTEGDSGSRPNDRARLFFQRDFLTFTPDARTTVLTHTEIQRFSEGLPGPTTGVGANSLDDSLKHRFDILETSVRRRFGNGHNLWLGVRVHHLRDVTSDPLLDSFPGDDPTLGPAFGRQRFESKLVMPQARLDLALNRSAAKPAVLSLAYQKAYDDIRVLGTDNELVGKQVLRQPAATLEFSQWFTQRLSFIARVRTQRQLRRDAVSGAVEDFERFLPSLIATYQPDARSALRLTTARQFAGETIAGIAPVDTLLLTNLSALPTNADGWETMRITQLDFERHLSERDFVKISLFRTTADNMTLGGEELPAVFAPTIFGPAITVNRWRAYGVGATYERQVASNMFGTLSAVYRATRSDRPGAVFDGQTGPYDSRFEGALGLNYIDAKGAKFGLSVRHRGGFFMDHPDLVSTRPRFPAQTYVDLKLAKELGVRTEVFLSVRNVFDRPSVFFNGFPVSTWQAASVGGPFLDVARGGGRQFSFGVIKRF